MQVLFMDNCSDRLISNTSKQFIQNTIPTQLRTCNYARVLNTIANWISSPSSSKFTVHQTVNLSIKSDNSIYLAFCSHKLQSRFLSIISETFCGALIL